MRHVRENIAVAQAYRARNVNRTNRTNTCIYHVNDRVFLHKSAVPETILRNPKLQHL
jgi:hypothetical protein